MKARDYKNFTSGEIYHVYNRGVDKMNIFRDMHDYRFFLERLGEYVDHMSPKYSVGTVSGMGRNLYKRKSLPIGSFDVICYCLMPNHIHLVIRQNTEVSLSQLLLRVMTGYGMYFNKKYKRIGSIFQDQTKAVPVETDEQLLWLSGYIHSNPTVAGLVKSGERYSWSSHSSYIGKKNGGVPIRVAADIVLDRFAGHDRTYAMFVKEAGDMIKKRKKEAHALELLLDE